MITSIDEIPRKDLIDMLKDAAWNTGGDTQYPEQGFSLDVAEETCYRDVLYRKEKIYPTSEEAIIAHWNRHYSAA